jgi:hypothetical protein
MPHITLDSDEPGIRGLLRFRPETGRPLSDLAEVLLRRPGRRHPARPCALRCRSAASHPAWVPAAVGWPQPTEPAPGRQIRDSPLPSFLLWCHESRPASEAGSADYRV